MKKPLQTIRKRQRKESVGIFLIFPRVPPRRAGISTWHTVGIAGCYGVIGPDPSAVLDKFKRVSDYLRTGDLSTVYSARFRVVWQARAPDSYAVGDLFPDTTGVLRTMKRRFVKGRVSQ
jgi:hypothetical protein